MDDERTLSARDQSALLSYLAVRRLSCSAGDLVVTGDPDDLRELASGITGIAIEALH